ncbi:type II secretion system F family protein [Thioflexithrix psekupsensis]|uniref:Type II secretion system protein GspF domain-containing protein n=1 Tax=Thioflexithrix psekupsensis TaxID=1570016 RepID=A0A251X935_9GAMM|nr:type II secretion system F family protein [Thioflexithrix psekupsensis]OUD14237.1 hypothetical protein TPSD3_07870 [Thioflexithrix psekupsensis]
MAKSQYSSYEQTTTFLNKMALLLDGKQEVSLVLDLLRKGSHWAQYKMWLEQIEADWKKHGSFALALGSTLPTLEPFFTDFLRKAEQEGQLSQGLLQFVAFRETKESGHTEVMQKLLATLAYYLVLSVFFVIFLIFAGQYIVPNFVSISILSRVGSEPPITTQIVTLLSSGVSVSVLGLLVLVLIYIAARADLRDWVLKRSPLIGDLFLQLTRIQVLNTLAFLLRQGYPIHDALIMTANSLDYLPYQRHLQEAAHQVKQQQHPTTLDHFSSDNIGHLLLDVKNGELLADLLMRLARLDFYKLQQRVPVINTILMWLLSLLFGAFLLLILLGLYMPIFLLFSY